MNKYFGPERGNRSRLLASFVLICISPALFGEEPKRIPPDEALSAATSKIPPDYPLIAKQMKISGSVELRTTIEEDGTVNEVSTVSGNPILAKAAMDAVKHWKFKPFKADGKEIKVTSTITIAFKGGE